MIELRPYQQELVDKIYRAWLTVRVVLAVLSTGGGKTVIFASIIRDHKGASAAIVHRKEIIVQISCALARCGIKHRVVGSANTVALARRKHLKEFGKSFIDPHALCGVVSVQTLTSKASERDALLQRWVRQVTLAVYDECQHYTQSGFWARAVEIFDNAKQLHVTATPERADGKGLGAHADGFAEGMVEGPPTQWLIEQGFLSRFLYKAPASDLDLDGIPITASGEFSAKVLRARTVESELVGDAVKHYREFANGQKTIAFASDVETAEELAARFNKDGIKSVALSGKTDQAVRDRELDNFENGDTQVLFNVDLFDEGFDVPAVVCVMLLRPTQSLAKYLQMVGRALRILEGKGHAVIIDPVRNWERHGMPNWPRVWTLDAREKGARSSKSDTVPQRVCDECTQPYPVVSICCPWCGAALPEPQGRARPDQVDGDLMELDVEGMMALFDKMRDADMDDSDYALDQLQRNIPPVGRGADMKRHREARYRRQVLKELVAWWVGWQPPERPMREKHRRFFHRFGVDIGTAFTLNAKDTDALIKRIEQRFNEDMTL